MIDLILLAKELGFAIQNDMDYIDFRIKEQNLESDENLQEIIKLFNLKKTEINEEIYKTKSNQNKIDELNKEINTLYNDMISNQTMKSYNESKEKFAKKLEKVSFIINKSAEGHDPYSINDDEFENCNGNCSGCSGCN